MPQLQRIMQKQATLGAFGFKKAVLHRGVSTEVAIPSEAKEELFLCEHCNNKFKSSQGLAFHMKCKHPDPAYFLSQKPTVSTKILTNNDDRSDQFITWQVKKVVNDLVKKVATIAAKSSGAQKLAGKKRHQYTAAFKVQAINAYENNMLQEDIAEKYGVAQSQVSRWIKTKDKIMMDAASSHRKLFRKGRPATKYRDLFECLWKEFQLARSKGHLVNFAWLWTKARKIQHDKFDPNVIIKSHVIVRFLQKYRIRMRSKQRNKKKHKNQKIPGLMTWHSTFRERCIRTGATANYDPKWGRFLPMQRLNVDQSPLPFVVHGKRTYEHVPRGEGSLHNTWIAQPGSGLEKRQCSLQVMFRPVGNQPRLSIIFRGTGKRISMDEKLAWHPEVDVFFQSNAWLDKQVCIEWCKNTLTSFVQKESITKFVLLLDNLKGQMQEDFKEAVSELNGLLWYGLPDATDLWQPVDAGYASCLKSLDCN